MSMVFLHKACIRLCRRGGILGCIAVHVQIKIVVQQLHSISKVDLVFVV